MLDFPATGSALWALYDATGCIRPEYAIASMNAESGLNPGAVNGIGCTGLNQMCGGVPSGYASWPASQQIAQVIAPFWRNFVATYGPIRSGARLEQGNWYPASLGTARGLSDVVHRFSSPNADSAAFDPQGKGYATVGDVANFVSLRMNQNRAAVQSAISATYALRPGWWPNNPVYGSDFGPSVFDGLLIAAAALTVGAAAAMAANRQHIPDPVLALRRALA